MNPHEAFSISEEHHTTVEYSLVNEGESLDDYFVRMGESVPHIKIELYSGAHATNEDANAVREMLPRADIYIPEMVAWTEEQIERLNKLSQKKIFNLGPEQSGENGMRNFSEASRDALKCSGAAVVSIDLPEAEYKLRKESMPPHGIFPEHNLELPFDEAVEEFEQEKKLFAIFQVEREAYMRAHLGPKILEAIRLKPELREKSEIKVFMPLGSSHTDIYHKLQSAGTDIQRTFQSSPYIYPYGTEHHRSEVFGIPVDKELKERSFIEKPVFEATGRLTMHHESPLGQLMKRVLVEILDPSERREFYASYQGAYLAFNKACKEKNKEMKQEFRKDWEAPYRKWAYGRKSDFKREIAAAYADILKKKNILLPTTDEEKVEFLRAHAPDVVDYIERNEANQIVSEQEVG